MMEGQPDSTHTHNNMWVAPRYTLGAATRSSLEGDIGGIVAVVVG